MTSSVLVFAVLWIIYPCLDAQGLTTICPDYWTKYLERCYVVVNYRHSWTRSNNYCKMYGARLAEPAGTEVSDNIANLVAEAIPSDSGYNSNDSFWIGAKTVPISPGETVTYDGLTWSNDKPIALNFGNWAVGQPYPYNAGCAYIRTSDRKWYMGSCDMIKPFVCEMDPCPEAIGGQKTFMCNGKCLGQKYLCNGQDDCGNNLDEQNCTFSETQKTMLYRTHTGTYTLSNYAASTDITITIQTAPGTRINLEFSHFSIEKDVDFVEIRSPERNVVLTGTIVEPYQFTSSKNFVSVQFKSDPTVQDSGFSFTWDTSLSCKYNVFKDFTSSNTDIEYGSRQLASKQTKTKCETDCNENPDCYGFRYAESDRTCHFISQLPVPVNDAASELYTKTCPSQYSVIGSVPLPRLILLAGESPQQLATPFFPAAYVAMERLYMLKAPANNLITLEILFVDLCCGDHVGLYDHNFDLLETLDHTSTPHLIVSTGNTVYAKMQLFSHWQCKGLLLRYKQGCNITLTGSGTFTSPGYGTLGSYPDLAVCTWRVNAPDANRSITVHFNDFDFNGTDEVVVTDSSGESVSYGTTELENQSLTSVGSIDLLLTTRSLKRYSGRGFSAWYSYGCESLQVGSNVLNSTNYDSGDAVNVTCPKGYYFKGLHSSKSSVSLTCGEDGLWNEEIPHCTQAFCGGPEFIENGYIKWFSGVSGANHVNYSCNEGYELQGNEQVACLSTNTWETLPTCASPTCANITDEVPDAIAETLSGNGKNHGSVAELTCPQHQEIIGAQTVKCGSGEWKFAADASPSSCQDKKCETPLIGHAFLVHEPPYSVNQDINVWCIEGYERKGSNSFKCGVDTDLPSCEIKTCSFEHLDHMSVTNGDIDMPYGSTAEVSCDEGYIMDNATTTAMNVTCLHTGMWSRTPSCSRLGCGDPVSVWGSNYLYTSAWCTAYMCDFQFSCSEQFTLYGASSLGNTTVQCGNHGNWDFGDLGCQGILCEDPGHPADGWLNGDCFDENCTVTFSCEDGFTPTTSNGQVSTGMKCVYDSVSKTMKWMGEMPTCIDTERPSFSYCQNEVVYLSITMMGAATYAEPVPTDNKALKSTNKIPNVKPGQHHSSSVVVTYLATDYAGHERTCQVWITIPSIIICDNQRSTNLVLSGDTTWDVKDFLIVLSPDNTNITHMDLAKIEIGATSEALFGVLETQVTAMDLTTNAEETCTLQFRFRAADVCTDWYLHVPNANRNCMSNYHCSLECWSGFYFMENPAASNINVTCTPGLGWSEAPVCASASSNVIYTARYNYKYNVVNLNNFTVCKADYDDNVKKDLELFTEEMENLCNDSVSNGEFRLELHEYNVEYKSNTNRLEVSFKVIISANGGSDDVLNLKDQCAQTIASTMNTMEPNKYSIWRVDSSSENPECGYGTYDLVSTTPSFEYECPSDKTKMVQGLRKCLVCPEPYYFSTADDNCVRCEDGFYWVNSTNGPECKKCTDSTKTIKACSYKGHCPPGSFSKDGLEPCTVCPKHFYNTNYLARECIPCSDDTVTLTDESTSADDCKTQAEAESQTAEPTPCQPNPCHNGGTCSYKRSDSYCTCSMGYIGYYCETEVNACSSKPCRHGTPCTIGENGEAKCACTQELSGDYCENDIFGCQSHLCANGAVCHNKLGNYECKCGPYYGYTNSIKDKDFLCKTEIQHCEVEPKCKNNAECIVLGNHRICQCAKGFTGQLCDTDIDDCDPDPCEFGICVDHVDAFQCVCDDDHHGERCEFVKACNTICADGDPISECNTCEAGNTEECLNIGNSYSCKCKQGFVGSSCKIEDSVCNSYPCQHNGICMVTSATYNCQCPEPWTGSNCEEEINNCPNGTMCHNGGRCHSTYKDHQCECLTGFIGENCEMPYNLCSIAENICLNGGECTMSSNEKVLCDCADGNSGENCQIEKPTCTDSTCQHGGTCAVIGQDIKCTCVAGYGGSLCEMNIDDCVPGSCTSSEDCIDGLNEVTCVCKPGRVGPACKVIGNDFDFLIVPKTQCRKDASVAIFGGSEEQTALTISGWVRYSSIHGQGTICSFAFSDERETSVPENDVRLTFDRIGMHIESPSLNRKKRAVKTLSYGDGTDIADGSWHHFLFTWSNTLGEFTLYVDGNTTDQLVFARQSLGTSGLLEIGAFKTETGLTDESNSFEGRLSRLSVVPKEPNQQDVNDLFDPSFMHSDDILNAGKTLLPHHSIDYKSELSTCYRNGNCPGLAGGTGVIVPVFTSCPDDTLAVTPRNSKADWKDPATNQSRYLQEFSLKSEETTLAWGVYGISSALFDGDNSAAVCTFRLYNYEVGCGLVDGDNANCTTLSENKVQCTDTCPSNQALSGGVPAIQTCSLYGMFDEAVKYTRYPYPVCSSTTDLTKNVGLEFNASSPLPCDDDFANAYATSITTSLNNFNSQLGQFLCPTHCDSVLQNAVSCLDDHTIHVNILFGFLSQNTQYDGKTITAIEALKLAVGYHEVFDTLNVTSILSSVDIRSVTACATGYELVNDKCVECGAGTYYDSITSTCKRCAIGTFRTSSDPILSCRSCHESMTTVTEGAIDETFCHTKCLWGQYMQEEETRDIFTSICRACEVGFYSDATTTGQPYRCNACSVVPFLVTAGKASNSFTDCVTEQSLTTTEALTQAPTTASRGQSREDSGLSVGIIVVVVLSVVIGLLIFILIVCFCCCKQQLPCFDKKKQIVSPAQKEGYYANRYGETNLRFVNYNLQDVREKKGKSMDRLPFVEPPLSDESGSVKTDISVHVPVFTEKLDGSVKKKSVYMSNGGHHVLNASFSRSQISSHDQTPRAPLTSSPRGTKYMYEDDEYHEKPKSKKRRKRHRKDRSSERRDGQEHHHRREHQHHTEHYSERYVGDDDHRQAHGSEMGQIPKALAPMPTRLKSVPPTAVHIRPSSALNQPRAEVVPAQYQDFLDTSPTRSPSRSPQRSQRSHHKPSSSFDPEQNIQRIAVESSDEDLR